jgi:signal transduction histidine kinase
MLLVDFVTHLTRLIFLAIAVITLFEYVANRDDTRLDIAFMFGSLAIVFGFQELASLTGLDLGWLAPLSTLALLAQPFLLVRLVAHFQPIPVNFQRFALAGMVLSWIILLTMPGDLPLWALVIVVGYFGWAELYATWAFLKGARATGGVTRWRLLLAAIGSGLLGVAVILAGAFSQVPAVQPYSAVILQFLAGVSAVTYYFGFAPPRWLRQNWQLNELHRFLQASAGRPAADRAAWMLPFLCETAARAVGGRGTLAGSWEEPEQQFRVRAATETAWATATFAPSEGIMIAAWREQRPRFARRPGDMSAEGRRLAEVVGASSLMAVPVATLERKWGLLVVFMRRSPLFADDDLSLLALFAEQAALAIDQHALLVEQQSLVEDLRARTGQLEASNAELEAFSYSVSHDLRAPLRHIEGFTDLLRRDGVAPEQARHHLQRISEAAIRMGRLIDDLLTFSRMGRAELRRVPLRLDRLMEDVRNDLAPETAGRDIVWRLNSLPEVLADPDLLRLVIHNLLSNAVKYTRGRQPAVIEVGTLNGAANEAVIYIKDNGVGFDMQYVDKLFGVFQRLHHADEFEGVGIGLANVRRIINRHGGRTWAEGQPNAGATFFFSLPVHGYAPAARAPQPTSNGTPAAVGEPVR